MKNTISIEAPSSNVLQRVKWQYVSLAAGLALAVTAAVGFGGSSSKPTTTVAPRHSSVAINPALDRGGETVVFYLAGSAAQAAYATQIEEEARWERHDSNVPEPRRSVHILDASTEQEAAKANKLVDDAMAAANFTSTEAPAFVIRDLR